MRDYVLMRQVMAVAVNHGRDDGVKVFYDLGDADMVEAELNRLHADGLLDADIGKNCFGAPTVRKVGGLTDEGAAFFRLVENPEVWRIVHGTLEAAAVDISYPLLKEVCEEIVKRYVTSFIPDIPNARRENVTR